jgi:ABC-2 type transport system permease protein
VRRIDYFLGKLGVVAYFLGMVLIVPSIIAYVLGLVFSLDLSIVKDTFPLLLAALGYGVVMTLSIGLLILALSALSRNSRFVALFWVGVWFVSFVAAQVLAGINGEMRQQAHNRRAAEMNHAARQPAKTPEEQRAQQIAMQDAVRKLEEEIEAEEKRQAKKDWRPMISFATNLTRVGTHMLGTDASWERLAEDLPKEARYRFLQEWLGPRYPWYWSAIVLLGLFGLSVCILNFRVKSLDRLR